MEQLPESAISCPEWVAKIALTEFVAQYQGTELETHVISLESTGTVALREPLLVVPTKIIFLCIDEKDWVDSGWEVSLSPASEATIRNVLNIPTEVALDPFIPGITYETDTANESIRSRQTIWTWLNN